MDQRTWSSPYFLSSCDFHAVQNGRRLRQHKIRPLYGEASRKYFCLYRFCERKRLLHSQHRASRGHSRHIRSSSKRVLAIFSKEIGQELYNTLCYTAKKIEFSCINISETLKRKLASQLLEWHRSSPARLSLTARRRSCRENRVSVYRSNTNHQLMLSPRIMCYYVVRWLLAD